MKKTELMEKLFFIHTMVKNGVLSEIGANDLAQKAQENATQDERNALNEFVKFLVIVHGGKKGE